jgi:diguanylate cyclase (GGDEF)-like protein
MRGRRIVVAGSILASVVLAAMMLEHLTDTTILSHGGADTRPPAWLPIDALDIVFLAILAYLGREYWLQQTKLHTDSSRKQAGVERFRMQFHAAPEAPVNLRTFESIAAARLARGEKLAIMLLNLNDFNDVNEKYGYGFGDSLLQQVGDRLRAAMADPKAVAHLFSDEFAIIAADHPTAEDVHSVALHLLRALDDPFFHDGVPVRITACIGIAQAPAHGSNAAALMQVATHALRVASQAGRGVWRVYDPAMRNTATTLRGGLAAAIANGEIVPYYQPIVDRESSRVAGLEVLARWHHPTRGVVSPNLFIDIADEEGQLSALTLSLLRQVVRDVGAWPNTLFIAFNVAASQLHDIDSFVLMQPDGPTLPPGRLEVELTENQLIRDLDATRAVVRLLRSRGTRVVLDDFGAGHGNFHHLRSIPFDRLKIDKEFVLNMVNDPRAEACVRSIADAANRLGIDVTAEGVSTPEIAARIGALGCRYMQGSLFSMPVQAEAIPAILDRLGVVSFAAERRLVPV